MNINIIKDKFKESRGKYTRILKITCKVCGSIVCYYQKDGPGILKRLYKDKILNPEVKLNKNLICKKCKEILGHGIVYAKESRPAFRLFVGAVGTKIIKVKSL